MSTNKTLFPSKQKLPLWSLALASVLVTGCGAGTDTDATGGAATGGVTAGGGTSGSTGSGGATGGEGGAEPCETRFTVAELSTATICESAKFAAVRRFQSGEGCEGYGFGIYHPDGNGTTLEFSSTNELTYRRDFYHVGFSESCETGVPRLPYSKSCDELSCFVCRSGEIPDRIPDGPSCEQ